MTTGVAVAGVAIVALVGWFLGRKSTLFSVEGAGSRQQVEQVLEIDRRVTSTLASLRDYEKRILAGEKLARDGGSTTKRTDQEEGRFSTERMRPRGHFLPEPLNGRRLINIKREANREIWECSNALARSTAVLEGTIVRHAHDLVDALICARDALEEHEAGEQAEELGAHVQDINQSRTRFLKAARENVGDNSVSKETEKRIETLTEQVLAPCKLSRPYVDTGTQSLQD